MSNDWQVVETLSSKQAVSPRPVFSDLDGLDMIDPKTPTAPFACGFMTNRPGTPHTYQHDHSAR